MSKNIIIFILDEWPLFENNVPVNGSYKIKNNND